MKTIIASLFVALSLSGVAVPFADAGSIDGPRTDTRICQAFGSIAYTVTFRGGEQARIAIVGDGATDLDIFVYDANGRLIAQGEVFTWVPSQTQSYRIVIRNLGSTSNRVSIATN